jgi:hypothetical protein
MERPDHHTALRTPPLEVNRRLATLVVIRSKLTLALLRQLHVVKRLI